MIKAKLLKAYNGKPKGEIVELTDREFNALVPYGYAEKVKEEVKEATPPVDKMVRKTRSKSEGE